MFLINEIVCKSNTVKLPSTGHLQFDKWEWPLKRVAFKEFYCILIDFIVERVQRHIHNNDIQEEFPLADSYPVSVWSVQFVWMHLIGH